MKRKLKSHFNLYSDDPWRRHEAAAAPSGMAAPTGPCAYSVTCGAWVAPSPGRGLQTEASGGCWGSRRRAPGEHAEPSGHMVSPRKQRERRLPGPERAACERTSPSPPGLPLGAGAYWWDKSTLLLAFIFSRRFTKWPLLTSSSSVLSSAERSCKQGGETALRSRLPPRTTGPRRRQSCRQLQSQPGPAEARNTRTYTCVCRHGFLNLRRHEILVSRGTLLL